MANVYSDIAKGGLKLDYTYTPGTVVARTAVIDKTYAAGDKLYMVPVPKGAMILDVEVVFEAMAATSTIDVGDSDDADRYLDGVDTTSAAVKHSNVNGPVTTAFGHVMEKDDYIIILSPVVQSADKQIICTVYYKMVNQLADELAAFGA